MGPLGRLKRTHDAEPAPGRVAKAAAPAAKGTPPTGAGAKGRVGSRSMTGRVTPKGRAGGRNAAVATARVASGRYTPPQPRAYAPSPRWVPVLMFGLWGLAILLIVANYLGALPHFPGSNQAGGTDNWWLLTGLVLALGGFVVATRYK